MATKNINGKFGKTNTASSEAIVSFLETMHVYISDYEWHIMIKQLLVTIDKYFDLYLEACHRPGLEPIIKKYCDRVGDAFDELEDLMYQINGRRLRHNNSDASIPENEMNEPNNV